MKTPMPFMLYCRERRDQDYLGYEIKGFSKKFCDKFYPTPTDVGMCVTKDLNVKELLKADEDYMSFFEAEKQSTRMHQANGNRNAESTFIFLTDVFAPDVNQFPKYQVRTNFELLRKQRLELMYHLTISDHGTQVRQ